MFFKGSSSKSEGMEFYFVPRSNGVATLRSAIQMFIPLNGSCLSLKGLRPCPLDDGSFEVYKKTLLIEKSLQCSYDELLPTGMLRDPNSRSRETVSIQDYFFG